MSDLQVLTPSITPSGSGASTPKAVSQEWISAKQREEELAAKESEIGSLGLDLDDLNANLEETRKKLEETEAELKEVKEDLEKAESDLAFTLSHNSISLYENRFVIFFSVVGIISLFVWFTQIIAYYWKGEDTKKKNKRSKR